MTVTLASQQWTNTSWEVVTCSGTVARAAALVTFELCPLLWAPLGSCIVVINHCTQDIPFRDGKKCVLVFESSEPRLFLIGTQSGSGGICL